MVAEAATLRFLENDCSQKRFQTVICVVNELYSALSSQRFDPVQSFFEFPERVDIRVKKITGKINTLGFKDVSGIYKTRCTAGMEEKRHQVRFYNFSGLLVNLVIYYHDKFLNLILF